MDVVTIGVFATLATVFVGIVGIWGAWRTQAQKEGARIQRLNELETKVENLEGRHDELFREHMAVRDMTIRQDEKLTAILEVLRDVQKDLKSHLQEG